MNLLDELRKLGVSVDEGVKRLGGSAAIYKKMLKTFAKMTRTSTSRPTVCERSSPVSLKLASVIS